MFCFIIAILTLCFCSSSEPASFFFFFCYFPSQHLTHRGVGFSCVPDPPLSLVVPFILKSPVSSSRNLALPLIILALSAQCWGKVFLSVKSCSWLLLVGSCSVSFLLPLFQIIFEQMIILYYDKFLINVIQNLLIFFLTERVKIITRIAWCITMDILQTLFYMLDTFMSEYIDLEISSSYSFHFKSFPSLPFTPTPFTLDLCHHVAEPYGYINESFCLNQFKFHFGDSLSLFFPRLVLTIGSLCYIFWYFIYLYKITLYFLAFSKLHIKILVSFLCLVLYSL